MLKRAVAVGMAVAMTGLFAAGCSGTQTSEQSVKNESTQSADKENKSDMKQALLGKANVNGMETLSRKQKNLLLNDTWNVYQIKNQDGKRYSLGKYCRDNDISRKELGASLNFSKDGHVSGVIGGDHSDGTYTVKKSKVILTMEDPETDKAVRNMSYSSKKDRITYTNHLYGVKCIMKRDAK